MKTHIKSEFSLIKRIAAMIPQYTHEVIKGIGDDAAVIKMSKNKCLLFTCDSQVSGKHFLEQYLTPYQIGRKAVSVNLSDIAAMGGSPKYLLISLFLPKQITKKFIDELYKGINEECKKYTVGIIGGNISESNQFIIDIFLIGEITSKNAVLRSGAKVGDVVMVTGNLGGSAKGLEFLKKNKKNYSSHEKQLISRHQLPNSRVNEGISLRKTGMVHSMIDLSDGLSSDIQHICDESKVGIKLFLEKIPTAKNIDKTTALHGGEDYELCFTTVPENVKYLSELLKKKTKANVTVIGEIIPSKEGRWFFDKNGKKQKLIAKGFDHFN